MKLCDTRQWVALALSIFLSVGAFTACASQTSSGGQAADLPAGGMSPAYQTSYAYDPDSAGVDQSKLAALSKIDPMAANLMADQTAGFGADQRLIFTYKQQFDCVVGPHSDVNSIGQPADIAPQQFAAPECVVGLSSKLSPSGQVFEATDPLFVLVPFFESDKKTPAFSKALGKALKKLFGFVPDAFKPNPGVAVQCPAPKDKPASCTMHPLQTNLGPLLVALGKLPKGTDLYVPLVNHDHLLNNTTINQASEWWKIIIVLVEDPSVWPNAQGTSGITSLTKLREAQAKKQASVDVPSNFFLFFSSKSMGKSMSQMPGMHM